MNKNKRNGALLLFFLLLIFWVIVSGSLTFIEIVIGAIASLLIVIYSYDLIFSRQEVTKITIKTLLAGFVLAYVLFREIIKANVQVAIIVLSPKMPIKPGFYKVRQPLKKDVNRVFYGNAITMTPGTLTVDMDEKDIVVHALTEKHGKALEGSPVEKAFQAFEEAGRS